MDLPHSKYPRKTKKTGLSLIFLVKNGRWCFWKWSEMGRRGSVWAENRWKWSPRGPGSFLNRFFILKTPDKPPWRPICYGSFCRHLWATSAIFGAPELRLTPALSSSPNSACTEGSWRCWFRSAHEPFAKALTLRGSIFPCNLQYFVTPTFKNT